MEIPVFNVVSSNNGCQLFNFSNSGLSVENVQLVLLLPMPSPVMLQ